MYNFDFKPKVAKEWLKQHNIKGNFNADQLKIIQDSLDYGHTDEEMYYIANDNLTFLEMSERQLLIAWGQYPPQEEVQENAYKEKAVEVASDVGRGLFTGFVAMIVFLVSIILGGSGKK
ncbi:hypothetical protein [Peptostreptococcus faecalis]|uniref:hypothetical protein n=1 Tax=Peptostreptococcus faecalis TaxID=2045015 RepID=UPI000C7C70B4|nr:hypothetical protein [Peptostreptococcus faecalis]